jgi:hypothetical protein
MKLRIRQFARVKDETPLPSRRGVWETAGQTALPLNSCLAQGFTSLTQTVHLSDNASIVLREHRQYGGDVVLNEDIVF